MKCLLVLTFIKNLLHVTANYLKIISIMCCIVLK